METLNENLFFFFHQFAFQSDWLDVLILFTAEYLGWVLIASLVVFTTTHAHTRKEGFRNFFVIFTAALAAWGIAHLAKWLYVSPRPFIALPDVIPVFEHANIFNSFPSGHATFFASLAASVFAYHRWVGSIFIVGAIAIGIARVAAGVHFPIDVLTGWLLGAAIGYTAFALYHTK